MYKRTTDLNFSEDEFIIFKHSVTCPISKRAKTEMDWFVEHSLIPVYILIVQEQKELSIEIERKFNVKHDSPQIIVFKKGKVFKVLNHYDITREAVVEAAKN